jgi:hypothetical protein
MSSSINPLNAELNPVCHLLALLGAHHILHVSRIRVKFGPLLNLEFYCKMAVVSTKTMLSLMQYLETICL